MTINMTAIKDNLQNIAGVIVGLTYLKATGKRYEKQNRNTKFFSTVAANNAADGYVTWLPYAMF